MLIEGLTVLNGQWFAESATLSERRFLEPSQFQRTLICFSHLRWDFVFQRPQHLMSRFARSYQVIYWEEPVDAAPEQPPRLETRPCPNSGVLIATPVLPSSLVGEVREK